MTSRDCTAFARQRYAVLGRQMEGPADCGLCRERILCMFGEQRQGLARKSDAATKVEGRVGQPSQNRRFWRRCSVSGKWEGAADHAGRESCSGSLNRSKDWPVGQTQSWRREGDAGGASQNRRCRRWCGCGRIARHSLMSCFKGSLNPRRGRGKGSIADRG